MTPWIGFHSVIDRPEFGQPRRAADQHQRKQHQQHDIEPAAHQRPVAQRRGRGRTNGAAADMAAMALVPAGCNRGLVDHRQAPLQGRDSATRRRAGLLGVACAVRWALAIGINRIAKCPFA